MNFSAEPYDTLRVEMGLQFLDFFIQIGRGNDRVIDIPRTQIPAQQDRHNYRIGMVVILLGGSRLTPKHVTQL